MQNSRTLLLTFTACLLSACLLPVCLLTYGCKSAEDRSQSAPPPSDNPSATLPQGISVAETKDSNIDDAALVLAQCGRPSTDIVLPIYNKMDNGPVRRMVYNRRRLVTVEFVPSHPIARTSIAKRGTRLPLTLPSGSVWRFDVARVHGEIDMITSGRVAYFLPCAATALKSEY